MNTYSSVRKMIDSLKNNAASDEQTVVDIANACVGWPYVYGGRGESCTPSNRKSRKNDEYPEIVNKCQVLSGKKTGCDGCEWYPGGTVLYFDCRGFTYWLFRIIDITIKGNGATSQYNDNNNWSEKGPIKNMPKDRVCCVFRYDEKTGKMEHTLLYDGKGNYIHCSGTVKKVPISKYKATHYAIPKGIKGGGNKPMPDEPIVNAVVYAENGRPVKLRAKPSTACKTYWEIPCGTVVDVINPGDEWTQVATATHTGYMMSQFLKNAEDVNPAPSRDVVTVYIPNLTKAEADEIMNKYPGAYIAVG